MFVFRLYYLFKKNIMPEGGGLNDVSRPLLQAFDFIDLLKLESKNANAGRTDT